jgi:hypothetical protein
MYFNTKSYLKNNRNYTAKQILTLVVSKRAHGIKGEKDTRVCKLIL